MSECGCKPHREHAARQVLAHTTRDPFTGTCLDCYKKVRPGKPAVLVADELPRTATTTGGV